MPYYEPENREQYTLSTIDEMVSSNNIVRIIDLMVEKMIRENPEEFRRKEETRLGSPSYKTSTLLKLYIYGYLNKISSSRLLEKESYRNKELIWLIGNLHPDHWTISNFRKQHGAMIEKASKLYRKFLKSNEYITLKKLAIDGTKVKANTNREMFTMEHMEREFQEIETKIQDYLSSMHRKEIKEDLEDEYAAKAEEISKDKYIIEKIANLESRIEELHRYKQEMEERGLKRLALSDPDSRLMLSRDGLLPCYNVEMLVDSKNHMIAAASVTTEENDKLQLQPMTALIEAEYGETPEVIVADTGYHNPEQILSIMEEKKIDIFVAVPKEQKKVEGITFSYDSENDRYICSEGKELMLHATNQRIGASSGSIYRGKQCGECPKKETCTTSKTGKYISRYYNQDERDRYRAKMSTKHGRIMMKSRRCIVEHVIGTVKWMMGKNQLLLRGKKKVATEINLYTMAYNLKRLANIENIDEIKYKMMAFSWK
jgi:transposase